MNEEFKDYKEKQRYYKMKANERKMVFKSADSLFTEQHGMPHKKGKTYVKPKGDK